MLRASLGDGRPASNLDIAGTLAQLGQIDRALAVLESMITERRVMIVHINNEPRLDPLWTDRRFPQLAARVHRQ